MTTNQKIITSEQNHPQSPFAEEIFDSIKSGALEKLISLVEEESYSLEVKDQDGFWPISLAARHGHLPTLEWLIKQKKCSINRKVDFDMKIDCKFSSYSPLKLAVYFGHYDMAKWIITETDCLFNEGVKADILEVSIESGHMPFIQWLVTEKDCHFKSGEITQRTRHNNSLYTAAKAGHLPIIKLLVEEYKFPLTIKNYEVNNNFLHWMLYLGHLEISKWLVNEKQFSLEEINIKENVVLLAIRKGNLDLLKWLIEEMHFSLDVMDGEDNVLVYALYFGQFSIAKWLVEEKNFSLDVKDSRGRNPVLLACAHGPLDAVKWLEEQGLSLSIHDGSNRNPVIQAVSHGQLEIAKYLVEERQCSLDVKSSTNGTCPIHYATLGGHFDTLKWLVDEQGCSLDATNNDNENILQLAYRARSYHLNIDNKDLIDWLIKDKNVLKKRSVRDSYQKCFNLSYNVDDFIKVIPYLLLNSENENEIFYWLELLYIQINSTENTRLIPKRNQAYEFVIDEFKKSKNPLFDMVLNHYCHINKHSVGHIEILMQENKIDEAIEMLYSLIYDEEVCTDLKHKAKVTPCREGCSNRT